ncbi:acetyl-CoA carboxylase biotin carboxyl carrier protein [Virgibacillus sp. W0181]|uniref:acetyl-CoA carboxylase biotin carboxyl carrier protein n=1 Tax=Virgibacillus sp. W0181 TaxID=3391581 RepID=UPI003F489D72
MLNVQEIQDIIKMVDQSSINEFSYETNGAKISMKKSGSTVGIPVPEKITEQNTPPQVTMQSENKQVEAPEANRKEVDTTKATENNVHYDIEIVSPMVGTFYSKPSPESDPYVKLNSKVEDSTIVCIVEAMKLFNEIEAETTGEIVEIMVEDGELVEYGQPLFRVKNN